MSNSAVGQGQLVIGRNQFSKNELLSNQNKVLEEIVELVKKINTKSEDLDSRESKSSFAPREKSTHVLSIMGGRGHGKTATLFAICRELGNLDNGGTYLVAPVLEPELLRNEEEIFPTLAYNFFRAFKGVEKSQRNGCAPLEAAQIEGDFYKIMEQHLVRSSLGLNMVAELAGSMESLAKRLTRYGSGVLGVAEKFHEWIDCYLKISGHKIVVFPIDDVDLCQDMGQGLLDTIRMYLSHPKVVVIITADWYTLYRSVLNKNLAKLPSWYTYSNSFSMNGDNSIFVSGGNISGNAELHNDSFKFDGREMKNSGTPRDQLVLREYNAVSEYSRQFLYKIVPPAYRVNLNGVSSSRRLNEKFSMTNAKGDENNQGITLSSIFERVVMIRDIEDHYNNKRSNGAKDVTIKSAITELMDSKGKEQSWMVRIMNNYPDVFSSSIRILLNQVQSFHFLVEAWRAELVKISESNFGKEKNNSNTEDSSSKKNIKHLNRFFHIPDLNKEDERMRAEIVRVEERMLMQVLSLLAINPEIQADWLLFFTGRDSAGVFENFNQVLCFINDCKFRKQIVDRSLGSHKDSMSGSEVSIASICFFSICLEYCNISEYSVWPRLNLLDDNDLSAPLEIHVHRIFISRIGFFMVGDSDTQIERKVLNDIRKMRIRKNNIDGSGRRRIIGNYLFRTNFLLRSIDRVRILINSRNNKFRKAFIERKDEFEEMQAKIKLSNTEVLADSSYRFFGLICLAVLAEIYELAKVFLHKEGNDRDSRIANGSAQADQNEGQCLDKFLNDTEINDDDWIVGEMPFLGTCLTKLLSTADNDVETRFLLLMYLSGLPMAPLLSAWPQSKENDTDAVALLGSISDLMKGLNKKFNEDAGELIVLADELYERKGKVIEIVEKCNCSYFIKAFIGDFQSNISAQCGRIDAFVDLLLELQNAKVREASDATNPPLIWRNLADRIKSKNG